MFRCVGDNGVLNGEQARSMATDTCVPANVLCGLPLSSKVR